MVERINKLGFMPLLKVGVPGWSAEESVDDDFGYSKSPDGGWDWPLWKWKGPVIKESGCAYGRFLLTKAFFVSAEWWPDLFNYRRSVYPLPEPDSVEDIILMTLRENGSMITRELRKACGFEGAKMRGKFDSYLLRLERAGRIVTEDFIYPRDKHGNEYTWGWALLTTPERLFGVDACHVDRTPEESLNRMVEYFLQKLYPNSTEEIIRDILKK